MKTGLSTYAYFWQLSEKASKPMSLFEAIDDSQRLGATVFQICDYPQITQWPSRERARLAEHAARAGITLELGTKGVMTDHLQRYLAVAGELDCSLLRTMINSPDHRPTLSEAQRSVETVLPAFENQGVAICFETYEQVPTDDNIALVKAINSERVGICLDPANCVASLELPMDVVAKTAPYVLNWHVKDFAFSRRDGWVGFTLAGSPLGEGLLRYDDIYQQIQPQTRDINQIIEHWLPWQGDSESTCRLEAAWTEHNMQYLLDKQTLMNVSSTKSKESDHVC
ncbi:TIM barrel protein [Klebsiella pneumoniae]|uniref:sugar phosphate isomerase/epimerase family protein n=1 Tax=Enterobacteriaceae TaxID=543 RepID=UPI001C7F6224|nr:MULTISPECIES: TIM barrel protein [Enterobacteriaceae]MBX4769150.1 TIM barrel protein [Klebsiella pneumoniae]MDU9441945.1 TIM barrel protein [Escherichia coli]MEA4200887.1 TIM barrel protein [Klebsiella pneumoniae]HBS7502082.1 sugar phosphate isomerase/epimerase [Klebsiella pneumoniae]